ncbi:MAG TPA: hypothetical protein VLX44_06325 [Xanthobacteraceae bacterium]|nr:hypothetical protein [Xanthobacteraceae bacterium]
MSDAPKPIRRVVTGNDAQGRSRVLFDSAAPNVKTSPFQKGTNMTDIWVFHQCPAVISGERDDGNLPFHFEPPHTGGHLRIVQSAAKPKDYDPAKDPSIKPPHPPQKTEGGTWERGGQNLYTTRTHKSETLDYGILLDGERILITDGGRRVLEPGDVVIQIGSWHAWANPNQGSHMAFVMMGASFEE